MFLVPEHADRGSQVSPSSLNGRPRRCAQRYVSHRNLSGVMQDLIYR